MAALAVDPPGKVYELTISTNNFTLHFSLPSSRSRRRFYSSIEQQWCVAVGFQSKFSSFDQHPLIKFSFQVKSSNNNEYRLKPVFGFVEPGASSAFEVTRLNGAPKEDKLVIQFVEVPADATDAQAPFKG